MSKQKEKIAQERIKRKHSNKRKILIIASTLLAVIVIVLIGYIRNEPKTPQITALRKYIFSETVVNQITADLQQNSSMDDIIIFLSLCNVKERAIVIKGKGDTLKSAWKNAESNAAEFIAAKNYNVVWAKADIVNSTEEILTVDLNKEVVENYYRYFYRKGIALDKDFDTAFLEAEVNGNKMITYYTERQIRGGEVDYDSPIINLTNINHYLKTYYGLDDVRAVPEKIITFTTVGFFCDEDGMVCDLYTQGMDYGRRVIDFADDKIIETAIIKASKYLYNLMQPDGKFIYGYYPIFDNELTSYNILRHSGSIWSLINLYRMTQDEELILKLNKAIAYLLEGAIEYKDADTAYVVERKADEIKLGGNGLAIVMLTEYMDVFKTDEYTDIVRCLANGILELEDQDTGTYYHVLNFPDYSRKEEYRTVYYDGEATFALARAYSFTKEQKYLEAAISAVENFITKDYTRFRDHWVAYALNEITKHVPEPRYFKFALQNVEKNLDRIYNQATSYHTYLELLMIGWQTYERMQEIGVMADYLEGFDTQYFAETIYKRVFHMLNGYFYPEIAMYMKRPYKILDAFFVRHDNFRVRIDDIQHFIGGYYYYTVYFNNIRSFLSEEFLLSINKFGVYSYNGHDEIDTDTDTDR
jgi:rhamnogalacturonyl hydrolase YesR